MQCFRLSSKLWWSWFSVSYLTMSQWKNVPGAICLRCGILIGMWCFSVWLEVGTGFYIGNCLNAKMWGTFFPLGPFTFFSLPEWQNSVFWEQGFASVLGKRGLVFQILFHSYLGFFPSLTYILTYSLPFWILIFSKIIFWRLYYFCLLLHLLSSIFG